MTNTTEATPLSYDGDDSTDDFAVSWKYFLKSHIVATLRDSAGAETVQVLDTDYTLTAPGDSGTLSMTTPPATGETLVITLEPPNTQLSDIPSGGAFPASTVEDALDLASQRDSSIEALFDRALRVPKTDGRSAANLELPIDSDRASNFLSFDANGDPIASAGTTPDTVAVTTYMETLLDDANAAAARTTLEISSGTLNDIVDDVSPQLGGDLDANGSKILFDDGDGIQDENDNELIVFNTIASAVNQIDISNADTGVAPIVEATGGDANIDLDVKAKGTGAINFTGQAITIGYAAAGPGELRFFEDSDNGTHYMGFKAPAAVTASLSYELPDGDGSDTNVLQTNGSGVLSWVANAAGSVARGDISTATVSLAGTVSNGAKDDITLTAYSFFPMIHCTGSGSTGRVGGHNTDGASADSPRMAIHGGASGTSWDVDYRYIQA